MAEDVERPAAVGDNFGCDVSRFEATSFDEALLEIVEPGMTVLDLGCGKGGQVASLIDKGAHVLGVDRVNHAVDILAALTPVQRHQFTFFQADMSDVLAWQQIAPNTVQVINCQRALHYLEFVDAARLLQKLRREVLAREGYLFLSVAHLNSAIGEDYPHRELPFGLRFSPLGDVAREAFYTGETPLCLYQLDDLVNTVKEAGFDVQKAEVSGSGLVVRVIAMNN